MLSRLCFRGSGFAISATVWDRIYSNLVVCGGGESREKGCLFLLILQRYLTRTKTYYLTLTPFYKGTDLENIVYHFFRQLWLVLGVKLMEINSNLFSRDIDIGNSCATNGPRPIFLCNKGRERTARLKSRKGPTRRKQRNG